MQQPAMTVDRSTDRSAQRYQDERREFWDTRAKDRSAFARSYHDRLSTVYQFVVPRGQRVLELGSGSGDLLAALEPSHGVGIDFAPHVVEEAQQRHPHLKFIVADAHDFTVDDIDSAGDATFDVVILSDLIGDLWDVQAVLERIHPLCTPDTRIVLNFFNRLWQLPLRAARRAGAARPVLRQNWLSVADVTNLLDLAGFDVVSRRDEVLLPAPVAPISTLANRFLVQFWPFSAAALTTLLVARPVSRPAAGATSAITSSVTGRSELSVSVIVPARNESGNIEAIIERTPQMGAGTELIFVEGNSTDDTYEAIERALQVPGREHVSLLRQPGKGKGDAVRFGYAHATGDILMILDADMTVAPEELPRFYQAIQDGSGEFINGVRLVYPMESEAMRSLNLIGNKFFGLAFSWLLGQRVKDTLCGTKVLTRDAYDVIAADRAYFGDFDPFGDFDLLFGASKSNLKIIDLPIRYRDRTYGSTNIDRWRHGVLLLRMSMFAARKLRFI